MAAAFINDVLDWLSEATQEDILQYIGNIPEEKRPSIIENFDDLLTFIINEQHEGLREIVCLEGIKSLDQGEIISLLYDISKYNLPSVVTQYQKTHPELKLISAPTSNVHDWALGQLLKWKNFFYLKTGFEYEEQQILLNSIYRLNFDAARVNKLLEDHERLYREILDYLSQYNYESVFLSTDLQQKAAAFLAQFTFLPATYSEELAKSPIDERFIRLFKRLNSCLALLKKIQANPEGGALTPEAIDIYLWITLELEAERQELQRRIIRSSPPASLEEVSPLLPQALALLTAPNISSGKAQELLIPQLASLPASQKQVFLNEVANFLISSAEIQAIFDSIDVQYFIDQLKIKQYPATKKEFIDSLEAKVDPGFWPLTKKAMLLFAALF